MSTISAHHRDSSAWNLGCRFLKTSLVKVLQGHDSPTRRFRRDNAFVLGSGPDWGAHTDMGRRESGT